MPSKSVKLALTLAVGTSVAVIVSLYFADEREAVVEPARQVSNFRGVAHAATPDDDGGRPVEVGGPLGRVEIAHPIANLTRPLPESKDLSPSIATAIDANSSASPSATSEEPFVHDAHAVQKLALEWTDYTGLTFTEADKLAIYIASVEWELIYDQLKESGASWEERFLYLEEVAVIKAIGIDRVVFEIVDHTKLFTTFSEDSLRFAIEPTYPEVYRELFAKYGDL